MMLMAAIGCSSITDGTPTVDASDAPAYRTSVSESLSASAATSSARESERQGSLTVEAVHTACETMSTTSADAIDALNVYVDSMNAGGDGIATEGRPVRRSTAALTWCSQTSTTPCHRSCATR